MWLSARWGGAFTPLLVVWVFSLISWRRAFRVVWRPRHRLGDLVLSLVS